MPQPQASGDQEPVRLAGINGLRALAAGAVVIYHVWRFGDPDGRPADVGVLTAALPHLWHGVTLFFVLSGFLLYRPFAATAMRGTPRPSLVRYVRHRALRVLPAYWLVLLITAFVLQTALVADDAGPRSEGVPDLQLLVVNALLVQNLAPDTIFTGIGPAWSLSVEAAFYALLPLLAAVTLTLRAPGAGRHAAALAPAALLLAVGASGKIAVLTGIEWDLGVVRSIWGLADLLAFGMLVAVVSINVEDGRRVLPRRWRGAAVACIVAVAAIGLTLEPTNLEPGAAPTLLFTTAVGAACALLIALVTLPAPGSRRRLTQLLERPAIAGMGVISYSVFLWHEPLLRWLRLHGLTADGSAGFALNLALTAGVTGVVAAITYRFVEAPVLRLKDGRRRARTAAPATLAPARTFPSAVAKATRAERPGVPRPSGAARPVASARSRAAALGAG
ncbi:MAG: acyltransferase, partial [Actinomycetota bacterium]|nr:acyltransferase [Actinomycetota bacterium]